MDFSYFALLILIFALAIFLALDPENLARNGIILGASFIALLFAYFSTLNSALVVSAVLVLLVAGVSVMFAVRNGTGIPLGTYFFIAWIPLMTVCMYHFTRQLNQLKTENGRLLTQLAQLVSIDTTTGLKNLRAFENDAIVYMKISKRYKMQLAMLVWQLKYQTELGEIVGMPAAVSRISDALQGCLRAEDAVYIVGDDPYRWGVMLFTNIAQLDIILGRVKERVSQIDFSDLAGKVRVPIELESGVYTYDGTEMTPLAFLNQATIDMLSNEKEAKNENR